MGDFYYAIGLLFLVFNIFYLTRYNSILKIRQWQEAFIKVSKRKPTAADTDKPDDLNLLTGFFAIATIEFIWTLFGLLSGSWKVFATLFVFYLLTGLIRQYIFKTQYSIPSKGIGYLILAFKTFIITALIMNHFHFHVDLFQIAKEYVF